MRLYCIGGASGSGKTAVLPLLQEILGERIAVYDFDDIGVPVGADKKWRQESTEKWLQRFLSDGQDAVLLKLGDTNNDTEKNLNQIGYNRNPGQVYRL